MFQSAVVHQFTCRTSSPQTQSASSYSLILRAQPILLPLKTLYIMQRICTAEPIMTNASPSAVDALGHSARLHLWTGSSVTLTEELLKPKWLVRVSCRTRDRWLSSLYNALRGSSSLSIGPDLELTCGPADDASVWGVPDGTVWSAHGESARRAGGVNSRDTWLLIKASSSGRCAKQIAEKWMRRTEKRRRGGEEERRRGGEEERRRGGERRGGREELQV